MYLYKLQLHIDPPHSDLPQIMQSKNKCFEGLLSFALPGVQIKLCIFLTHSLLSSCCKSQHFTISKVRLNEIKHLSKWKIV